MTSGDAPTGRMGRTYLPPHIATWVLVGGPLPYPSRLHDDGASMDAVHPLVDATTGLREEYGR